MARREPIQFDILNYRKDGTPFWNALSVSPVFDDGELVHYTASQSDVTERKRAEEHRFLLNRELDHRVKNTLATVQTVVLQTLRAAKVSKVVGAAVSGRMQAIARSHDVLTEEAWASALVSHVVGGALAPVTARVGPRISVRGPDVRLKPRIATMLSLAIHELGENAVRHGSLSVAEGTVDVSWTREADRFRLVWKEEGGPFVLPPVEAGYGMRIVERVLATEFGGTSRIDFDTAGVVFRLDAPAEGLASEQTEWAAP
jgi:two-component sensor histidine kinase